MSKRTKYFIKHFILSCIVAILAIILVFYVWYPAPLASATGVAKIFFMMLVIDVIVGPLLSFLVYKEGKKTLKFDLCCIIILQLCAFGYGIKTIAEGRPAWIVFYQNGFELVQVNEQFIENKDKISDEYKNVSWFGPQYAAVFPSADVKQRGDDTFAEAFGLSLSQRVDRYLKIEEKVKSQMQKTAIPLSELNKYNDNSKVSKILTQYPEANAWVPLKASAVDMVVLLDKDMQVVKIADLRPWK